MLGEICTDLCNCKNCENCDIYVQETEDKEFDTTNEHYVLYTKLLLCILIYL